MSWMDGWMDGWMDEDYFIVPFTFFWKDRGQYISLLWYCLIFIMGISKRALKYWITTLVPYDTFLCILVTCQQSWVRGHMNGTFCQSFHLSHFCGLCTFSAKQHIGWLKTWLLHLHESGTLQEWLITSRLRFTESTSWFTPNGLFINP